MKRLRLISSIVLVLCLSSFALATPAQPPGYDRKDLTISIDNQDFQIQEAPVQQPIYSQGDIHSPVRASILQPPVRASILQQGITILRDPKSYPIRRARLWRDPGKVASLYRNPSFHPPSN